MPSIYCYNCAEDLSQLNSKLKFCPFCSVNLVDIVKENTTVDEQQNAPIKVKKTAVKPPKKQLTQDFDVSDEDDVENRIIKRVVIKKKISEAQKKHLDTLRIANKLRALKIKEAKAKAKEPRQEPEPQQKPTNPYFSLF